MEGLEKYLNASMEQILSPLCSSDSSHDGVHKTIQQLGIYIGQGDSFLKLLLRIQSIQFKVMSLLIQKLVQCSTMDVENHAENEAEMETSNTHKNGDSDFSSSIINHIRFCEIIFQPRNLLELIMESISILSYSIQVEIISALPGMKFICMYISVCLYMFIYIYVFICL
jgi:hypothetical protein